MLKPLLCFFSLLFIFSACAQDATEVVKKADEKSKGKTSQSDLTIQIIRPSWTREMTMKTWTKGNDLAMILVTSPAKDKGTAFLKRQKEVWNWIPTIERNIKLPPSMMSQSWMGTDFTNDDLVKEASIVEDYNHSFLKDTVVEGRTCYAVQMLPKPQAAVIWGKVLLCIDKKDFMMLHAEYFDEDGKLVNTMNTSDIKMLGGRLLPARLEMIPAEKKGNKTVLIYRSIEFDKPIADNFFTTQNMPRLQ
jgi:outer membrane lipoprotein-sorting protein